MDNNRGSINICRHKSSTERNKKQRWAWLLPSEQTQWALILTTNNTHPHSIHVQYSGCSRQRVSVTTEQHGFLIWDFTQNVLHKPHGGVVRPWNDLFHVNFRCWIWRSEGGQYWCNMVKLLEVDLNVTEYCGVKPDLNVVISLPSHFILILLITKGGHIFRLLMLNVGQNYGLFYQLYSKTCSEDF